MYRNMKLVHAAASLALTGIGWSSSVAVGWGVLIMGSVVVLRIGRSTVTEPGGGHIGPEAGVRLADGMVCLSFFRRVRRGAPIPRLEPWSLSGALSGMSRGLLTPHPSVVSTGCWWACSQPPPWSRASLRRAWPGDPL